MNLFKNFGVVQDQIVVQNAFISLTSTQGKI